MLPPRLDGGTRFALDLPQGWRELADIEGSELGPLLELADDLRRASRSRRAGERQIRLPMLGRAAGVWADVAVQGERGQRVIAYVADCMRVELDTAWSPRRGYAARVTAEFKARLLHSRPDQRSTVTRWLRAASQWVLGSMRGELATRWLATNLEVCADFVGIAWTRDDARALVIPRGMLSTGDITTRSIGKANSERATLAFGTRASPLSWCLYNKTAQIADVKGGDESAYAHLWRLLGREPGEEVGRVELRAKGRALRWLDPATGDVLSLETVADATDPQQLARLWSLLTQRCRVCVPGSATRRKRWRVDPRWTVVRAAGGVTMPAMAQHREAERDTHAWAVGKAARDALAAISRYASLLGVAPSSDEGFARLFGHALQHVPTDLRDELGGAAAVASYRRRAAYLGDEVVAASRHLERSAPDVWAAIRPLAGCAADSSPTSCVA